MSATDWSVPREWSAEVSAEQQNARRILRLVQEWLSEHLFTPGVCDKWAYEKDGWALYFESNAGTLVLRPTIRDEEITLRDGERETIEVVYRVTLEAAE